VGATPWRFKSSLAHPPLERRSVRRCLTLPAGRSCNARAFSAQEVVEAEPEEEDKVRDSSANGRVAQIASDPAAFEAFYRRHLERVRRFVVRRVADPHLAADLIADVFLAAIDSAHTYRPGHEDPTRWLYGVARNVVNAERRRRARELRRKQDLGASPRGRRRRRRPGRTDRRRGPKTPSLQGDGSVVGRRPRPDGAGGGRWSLRQRCREGARREPGLRPRPASQGPPAVAFPARPPPHERGRPSTRAVSS
jgi:RNA polymerase sigma factor (sigma-70 family)